MAIRATSTPMLISTRKSIVCLEEHAVECLFLLVLLSALPLSTLGCTYGLDPWAEKKRENLIKEPLLPPFFSLSWCSLSFILTYCIRTGNHRAWYQYWRTAFLYINRRSLSASFCGTYFVCVTCSVSCRELLKASQALAQFQ